MLLTENWPQQKWIVPLYPLLGSMLVNWSFKDILLIQRRFSLSCIVALFPFLKNQAGSQPLTPTLNVSSTGQRIRAVLNALCPPICSKGKLLTECEIITSERLAPLGFQTANLKTLLQQSLSQHYCTARDFFSFKWAPIPIIDFKILFYFLL